MNDASDELFQTLLRELFQGRQQPLRGLLQPLTAEQRKALFEQFADLFKVLRQACRYEQDARPAKLSQLYEAIRDDPVTFPRDYATTLAAPGALNNPQVFQQRSYDSLMEFHSRLQLLQAGLAGKSGVAGAFKLTSQHPVRTQGFILNAGRILLDRPEPWVPEVLARIFDNLPRWMRFAGGDQGVARLMLEIRQQHPEWADTLAPWLGAAMRRDGFLSRSLAGCDAAMILAGLEYEPPAQDAGFEPLMDPKIVEALRRRMADGSLPRADLVALTLRKLQGPLRPSIAKCWIDLFGQLALTDAEIRARAEEFITLLNAPAPAASKLAFEIVEKYFLEDADRAAELVGVLGYVLQNPVQVLAKSALRLLKKRVKSSPELTASALQGVVAGLGSPHAAFRADLLRWLGTFQPRQFDEDMLTRLQSTAEALPPAELAPIAHLLTERPAAPDKLVGEADLDPRSELLARVAAIRRRAEADATDPLLQRRLAFLEHYLATGQCGELAAAVPDHASALSPPDFALHETAEALALDIARTQRRIFTQADYERSFAGILRFARSAHAERVEAILAPVLGKLEGWQQGSLDGSGWWGRGAELSALFLAWTWRGEPPPRFPKDSLGGQLLDSQFKPILRRRLRQVSALLAAGHDTLLSTPTHGVGWLTPTVFVDRFTAFPPHLLDAEDLGAALYRLPALPDQRAEAWDRLAPSLGQLDAPFADALTLALAPDAAAESALDRWLRCFEKHPPTEPVIHVLSVEPASDGLGGLLETFRIKIFHHDPNTTENVAFRLFNAALRCRFGLNDAGIAGRAPKLLERLSTARGWSNKVPRARQQNSALLAELLFAPRPLTEALFEQLSVSFPYYLGEEASHVLLWPYLLADSHYFATPNLIADQSFRFPPLAQRLFEAGLCRQSGKQDFYRDATRTLLEQGKLPHVDIRPHLERLARGLLATQTAQRETCVDVLLQGLRDGRVTPADLAGTLAGQIRDTEQGFAPLDQALASLSAAGEAGRATMVLALEQVIGGGVAAFSPRKLSLVLDRLAGVLEETRWTVHDPAARRELEQLAAAKKKSVARDKASGLVDRSGAPDRPPPQILAVAALAME
jgi:hypothetical protein